MQKNWVSLWEWEIICKKNSLQLTKNDFSVFFFENPCLDLCVWAQTASTNSSLGCPQCLPKEGENTTVGIFQQIDF